MAEFSTKEIQPCEATDEEYQWPAGRISLHTCRRLERPNRPISIRGAAHRVEDPERALRHARQTPSR